MTFVTILTRRQKGRVRMVGENVGSFLIWETIFAVGYHILGDSLHIDILKVTPEMILEMFG